MVFKILLLVLCSEFVIWTLILLWALEVLVNIISKLTNAFSAVRFNDLLIKLKVAESTGQYPNIRGRKNAKMFVNWILSKIFAKTN